MQDDLIFTLPPKRHVDVWAYLFIAPAVVLLTVFVFVPALWTILTSISPGEKLPGTGPVGGIWAYKEQLQSPLFWRAVLNTIYFAAVYVPGGLLVGYLLAHLIFRSVRARWYLVTLFFVPVLLPSAASGVIWRWVFAPETGLLNSLLKAAGWGGIDWLHEARIVLPCVAVVCVWQSAGLVAAIFLVARWAVPREYGEMAELDGARGWRRFCHVTLPSVQSATRVSLILLLINAHRVFAVIFMLTGDGGPSNWSTNLPFLIYREGMKQFNFGSSCALSTLLCFTIAIMAVLLRRSAVTGRESE